MRPTPAEIARTLAHGRIAATAHVACRPGPWPIRHATDCAGRPLLLARRDEPLSVALRPRQGSERVALAVCVEDRPPTPGAPGRGRVWVSGWASRVDGAAARRAAAIEFADVNPVADLLDIDDGTELYEVDVEEVRLATGGSMRLIDTDEYLAADPDPLHEREADLLADLADHHVAQFRPYLTRRLHRMGVVARPGYYPTAVRLDRYGFVVAPYAHDRGLGRHFVRLPFGQPVRDRLDLARLLHPVLFPAGCHVPGR